ncbi:MAG: DNA-binding transcriptional regulator [Kiritimatiellae bacterium]|nr:DNA-binding transcriptional regulator [Kiritimatiellia bacterium]
MSKDSEIDHASPTIALFISLALKGERSTIRGILDYAAEHGPWFCIFMEGRPHEQQMALARERGVAGVIATGLRPGGEEDLRSFRAPVVLLEPFPEILAPDGPLRDIPWVGRDSWKIGAMAAEYYIGRGYKSFAYFGEPQKYHWSAERRRGFEETLAKAGFGCLAYDDFAEAEKLDWVVGRSRLVRFLEGLPKPAALFAPMDSRARLVLAVCRMAGIKVPEHVAVLGVDNDQLLCESTIPALSSIHTGGYTRGRIAAKMLDDLMHGREPGERAVSLPPISVVTRGSTGYDAMSDPSIAKAISFIRKHARSGGISVVDIVRAAGCSRRYLERRFRERLGRSVHDELMSERIECVKSMLETTGLTIEEITGETGFARSSHLAFLFRKATGMTMMAWRRNHREAPDA